MLLLLLLVLVSREIGIVRTEAEGGLKEKNFWVNGSSALVGRQRPYKEGPRENQAQACTQCPTRSDRAQGVGVQ
jgi:hypothetical protein